ncbi:MAG TPA: hypothetical protein VGO39_06955 [Gaiellaceae bacterium]|jgi:uncharacterized membrane protein HdeD (DUF308 family)|nr:hypothetical protein [Gaiellaceae bacterium]
MSRALSSRPAVYLTGIFWALTGVTLLLSVVVIQRSHSAWWSFLLLVVPLTFGTISLTNLRRATKQPDDI